MIIELNKQYICKEKKTNQSTVTQREKECVDTQVAEKQAYTCTFSSQDRKKTMMKYVCRLID
jgi:hypothetical protein